MVSRVFSEKHMPFLTFMVHCYHWFRVMFIRILLGFISPFVGPQVPFFFTKFGQPWEPPGNVPVPEIIGFFIASLICVGGYIIRGGGWPSHDDWQHQSYDFRILPPKLPPPPVEVVASLHWVTPQSAMKRPQKIRRLRYVHPSPGIQTSHKKGGWHLHIKGI